MHSSEDNRCGEDEEDLFCSSLLPGAVVVVIVVGREASWCAKQMEQHGDADEKEVVVVEIGRFPAATDVVVDAVAAAAARLLVAI